MFLTAQYKSAVKKNILLAFCGIGFLVEGSAYSQAVPMCQQGYYAPGCNPVPNGSCHPPVRHGYHYYRHHGNWYSGCYPYSGINHESYYYPYDAYYTNYPSSNGTNYYTIPDSTGNYNYSDFPAAGS